MNLPKQLGGALVGVLLPTILGSCEATQRLIELDFYDLPDTRLENLDRLHTPRTGHHYTVVFVGDLEYVLGRNRRTIGGITIGEPGNSGDEKAPQQLRSPSTQCLELLDELLEFDSSDNPRLSALQVAWCARIIDEDPSNLSRERACLGLGPLAVGLAIEGPVSLPLDAPRADAEQTAALLADLISSWRVVREGLGGQAAFQEKLDNIRATTFDLNGSRRTLVALAGLLAGAPKDSASHMALVALIEDFERRTIEFSLARALTDSSGSASLVRAACVTACVEAGGVDMLARFMSVLEEERLAGAERDEVLVFRILDLLSIYGFPESFAGLSTERYELVKEGWYDLLVGIAVEDLDGPVRVKAMQALERTTNGPDSLREEDWEEWYYQRIEQRREREGLPPIRDAAKESEDPDA